MRSLALLAAAGLLLAPAAFAQPSFVEVSPPDSPYFATPEEEDFWVSAVAPADVDGDGDTDLAVLGYYVVYNASVEHRLVLLRNDGAGAGGNWIFTPTLVPLGDLFSGASDLTWGDFDGDGDHDLTVGSEGLTVIYRNDAGTLTALPNVLPGYFEDSSYTNAYDLRSITWADYDNDGDLDLLVPSVYDPDLFEFHTVLVRNDGPDGAGGWLLAESGLALDATVHAQSAWADDDGDGDLDLFLTNIEPGGEPGAETGFVRRLRNTGAGFTSEEIVPGFRVEWGLADWGDYDTDGDLDVLVAGNVQETDGTYDTVLRIYRNDAGIYNATTLINAPSVDWLDLHAATWADYDSDGDVDILLTGNYIGTGEIVGHSRIWANNGGTFSELPLELPAPVSSVGSGGSFTWFDVDNDGDLDYLVAGAYYVPGGNGLVETQMHLYRNGAPAANAPPTPPSALVTTTLGPAVTLSWLGGTDDHTSTAGLTYELEVRRASGPTATVKRLPEPGNLGATTDWTLDGLANGTYTWSVRTVDSAFSGSAKRFGTFTVGAVTIFSDGFETGDLSAWSLAVP